ncbi:MAG: D-cysteine desulfhydrase [Armatimonadaceae bacterium]
MSASSPLHHLLASIPRVSVALTPTPVHPLERLSKVLAQESPDIPLPRLWIKRDDLNGVALGGNKLRKLEFLLADAQAQGCDVWLTAGAAQSNHCRQTAAVGAMYGIPTHLCLRGPEPEPHTGNLLLNDFFGAILHFAEPGASVTDQMKAEAERLRHAGHHPYAIPIGGSNAVGSVGYAAAVAELQAQGMEPDYIVVATGSGGTQAGLEAGVRLAGMKTKVLGVGVADPDGASWEEDVSLLANGVAERLGQPVRFAPQDVSCPLDWMGPRYGQPTEKGQAARTLLGHSEGILLDSVYSAKAFAALLDWVRAARFAPSETVLFWHTGGAPSFFA